MEKVLFTADELTRSVITRHVNNIFKEEELIKKSNVQKMHIAQTVDKVRGTAPDFVYSLKAALVGSFFIRCISQFQFF